MGAVRLVARGEGRRKKGVGAVGTQGGARESLCPGLNLDWAFSPEEVPSAEGGCEVMSDEVRATSGAEESGQRSVVPGGVLSPLRAFDFVGPAFRPGWVGCRSERAGARVLASERLFRPLSSA